MISAAPPLGKLNQSQEGRGQGVGELAVEERPIVSELAEGHEVSRGQGLPGQPLALCHVLQHIMWEEGPHGGGQTSEKPQR